MKRIIFALMLLAVSIFSSLASDWNFNKSKFNGVPYLDPALVNVSAYPTKFLTTNPWTEGLFSAGDTTTTFSVSHAKSVYLIVTDSSISGTDSISWQIQMVYTNGVTANLTFSAHLMATTTATTFIASTLLIPGDATTGCWAFFPGGTTSNITFSGTFKLTRLNGVNAATPYAAKTRYAWTYE